MINRSCISAYIIGLCFIYSCTYKNQHSQRTEQNQQKASYKKIDFSSVIQDHHNDSLDFYEELY